MGKIGRSLWSLAALEALDPSAFSRVDPIIQKFLIEHNNTLPVTLARQLEQVFYEVNLKARNTSICQGACISAVCFSLSKSSSPFTERNVNPGKFKYKSHRVVDVDDYVSSYTHLDASKLLNALGICHENEKLLPHGYIVDIFVPGVHLRRNRNSDHAQGGCSDEKGLVIEFDGPFHFESYLQVINVVCFDTTVLVIFNFAATSGSYLNEEEAHLEHGVRFYIVAVLEI